MKVEGESWRSLKWLSRAQAGEPPSTRATREAQYDGLERVLDCDATMDEQAKIKALQAVIEAAPKDQHEKVKEFMQITVTAAYYSAVPTAGRAAAEQSAQDLITML